MKEKRRKQRQLPITPKSETDKWQETEEKELSVKIKSMEQKIRQYRAKRYPQKSILQILRKIREQFGSFGEAVAIAMIKRNQCLKELDWAFIAEEEAEIQRLGQPLLDQNNLSSN